MDSSLQQLKKIELEEIKLEEIKQKIRESLNDAAFLENQSAPGFCLSIRHKTAATEQIDRIFDEKTTVHASSFASKAAAEKWIVEAFKCPANMDALASWLLSDSKSGLQLAYTSEANEDEAIGTGISAHPMTRKVAEYATRKLAICVAKDDNMPNGFAIVKAFPKLDEDAKPTGRDISKDMQQARAYQKANPLDKTLFDIICRTDFDTEKFSVGIARPGSSYHTLYLSQQDPDETLAFTHRFSLSARKCLFMTYKSMDPARMAIKTDLISGKDKRNAISRYHNPEGMQGVYRRFPELGILFEYGYQRLQQHIKDDPKYRREA